MAGEIQAQRPTGETLYAILLNEAGAVWNGAAFDATPTTAEWATYDIAMTEDNTTGLYRATMPSSTAGVFTYLVYKQLGGSPAQTDALVWTGEFQWTGTAKLSLVGAVERFFTLDWTTLSGEASRSVLNALRALRNRFAISGGTYTVYEEDDLTPAWTATVSEDAAANPVVGIDP